MDDVQDTSPIPIDKFVHHPKKWMSAILCSLDEDYSDLKHRLLPNWPSKELVTEVGKFTIPLAWFRIYNQIDGEHRQSSSRGSKERWN